MAIQIQLRSGTTTDHNAFTGAVGELTYDTDKKQLRVHDGSTVGGKVVDDPTRNVTSQVSNATETVEGKAEIATQIETNAATDDTRFVTPKKLLAGVKNHLNATGSAPIYACRAWVNFNGTGTPTIIASGNVSSITDNGVGNYTVNFTNPLFNANYVTAFGSMYGTSTTTRQSGLRHNGQTASSLNVVYVYLPSNNGATLSDCPEAHVSVFG